MQGPAGLAFQQQVQNRLSSYEQIWCLWWYTQKKKQICTSEWDCCMSVFVFRAVTPCGLVSKHEHFGETHCPNHEGWMFLQSILIPSSGLNAPPKALVSTSKFMWCYKSEDQYQDCYIFSSILQIKAPWRHFFNSEFVNNSKTRFKGQFKST
jgi:hypothetical protein